MRTGGLPALHGAGDGGKPVAPPSNPPPPFVRHAPVPSKGVAMVEVAGIDHGAAIQGDQLSGDR
jgi:hypothetical protein